MTKFKLGDIVQDKDKAVGKIVWIDITENNVEYTVAFINENTLYWNEKDICSSKLPLTTDVGQSQADYNTYKALENEIKKKRELVTRYTSFIKQTKNRYDGKCKDGNAFWNFFFTDIEKFFESEIEGKSPYVKEETNTIYWMSIYDALKEQFLYK